MWTGPRGGGAARPRQKETFSTSTHSERVAEERYRLNANLRSNNDQDQLSPRKINYSARPRSLFDPGCWLMNTTEPTAIFDQMFDPKNKSEIKITELLILRDRKNKGSPSHLRRKIFPISEALLDVRYDLLKMEEPNHLQFSEPRNENHIKHDVRSQNIIEHRHHLTSRLELVESKPGHTTGGSGRGGARRGGGAGRGRAGRDADGSVRPGNNRPCGKSSNFTPIRIGWTVNRLGRSPTPGNLLSTSAAFGERPYFV